MAFGYRRVDRDQPFLLPPDIRDWLPDDHLAWFVIDAVDRLDMSAFEARSKLGGAGRAGFDPRMMLALLVYGYSMRVLSSRQLERLCGQDIAFMVITGQARPDHTTIARFRADHEEAFKGFFAQIRQLCAQAGMCQLGVVAIDGTKIAADASVKANASRERIQAEVDALVGQARQVDAAEDKQFGAARGDELPPQWRDRSGRAQRLAQALEHVQAAQAADQLSEAERVKAAEYEKELLDPGPRTKQNRRFKPPPKGTDRVKVAQAALERERQAQQKRIDKYQARKEQAEREGRKPMGAAPKPVEEHCHVRRAKARADKAQADADARRAAGLDPNRNIKPGGHRDRRRKPFANITDPDSRLLKSAQGGWVQGYNCQLAVSQDQVILVAEATQEHADATQFQPMMRHLHDAAEAISTTPSAGQIGTIVADAGYYSEANLTTPGPDRLIPKGKARATKTAATAQPAQGPPPPGSTPAQAMDHQLRTREGIATYAKRAITVEPVNGHLKDRIGLRRFSRRGLNAADSELKFAAAVANLLKLARYAPA